MNTFQITLLSLVAIFCVFKIASMCRETHEVQRWAFILLAIGAVWLIGCELQFIDLFWSSDRPLQVSRDLAEITFYIGIFLICADCFIGELIREGKFADRRNRPREAIEAVHRKVM